MPYTTQLPNGVIELDTNGLPIVTTNFISILNALGPSQEFTNYDVPGDQGATTLVNGDDFAMRFVDSGTGAISTVDEGTYVGDFTLSTASVNLNIGLVNVTVTLNPIEGELYQDENGNFFMISEEPLTEDRLGLSIELDPLVGPTLSVDLNLSDPLDGVPLVGNLVAPVIQQVLDTALVTFEVDVNGTLSFDDSLIPCFAQGTLIATEKGAIPVESLKVGDRVLTQDSGYKEIQWIGCATVSSSTLRANKNLRPIRIRAGALGADLPSEDLIVSPQHRVLMRSKINIRMFETAEVLVAAKKLLGFEGVERVDDCKPVEYYHFLFDCHEIVFANSAPTESLYTGRQALTSISEKARAEIFLLFPELAEDAYRPVPARHIPEGQKLKTVLHRHIKNKKRVVSEGAELLQA